MAACEHTTASSSIPIPKQVGDKFELVATHWWPRGNFKAGVRDLGDVLDCVNVCAVFQVNCPGCFSHALPILQELAEGYKSKSAPVNFFALSTAFENFELNSLDNTEFLVEQNGVIGEPKRMYLQQRNMSVRELQEQHTGDGPAVCRSSLGHPFNFHVAFDEMLPLSQEPEAITARAEILAANTMSQLVAVQGDQPPELLEELSRRAYNVESLRTHSATTFTRNGMQATPTWIVFKNDMTITYFNTGQAPIQEIRDAIEATMSML